ncbi:MAG: phenylalanine--tRNA ligase subunit beta [Patescibacteria group bacterium]|nr:phenylalanine--tRNA ligase subunit beta [Patescibacteria group bacterium]
MLLSHKLLSKFVDLSGLDNQKIVDTLTVKSAECEGYKKQGSHLEKVVVGKILSLEKHPDADKLNVTQTTIGDETFQIVCGAPNIYEGMYVPVALVGAQLTPEFEIKAAKIRGVESFGMLCSEKEMGVGEGAAGIMEIDSTELGKPIVEVFGIDDVVYDIDNKAVTNRPDLWGHQQFAREFSLLFDKEYTPLSPSDLASGLSHTLAVSVDVPETLCRRYMAVQFDGIQKYTGDAFITQILQSLDHSGIHPLVDLTNYTMEAVGQPMHAFDADKIQGTIRVRFAQDGEKFLALDENEYTLTDKDLVIADANSILALAGVIGGLDSSVTNNTTSVVIESANFDAVSVRQSAQRHAVRTDSSMRFEKTLDPENASHALAVLAEYLVSAGCQQASDVVDIKQYTLQQVIIDVPAPRITKLLGVQIDPSEVVYFLDGLGFEVQHNDDTYTVTVPTWRQWKDITMVDDVIEEIGRLYGYDRIEAIPAPIQSTPAQHSPYLQMKWNLTDMLVAQDWQETYSYSMIPQALFSDLGVSTDNAVEILKPLSSEFQFMATSGAFGMIRSLSQNAKKSDILRFFEVSKYSQKGKDSQPWDLTTNAPHEYKMLTLGLMTTGQEGFYTLRDQMLDIFESQGFDTQKLKIVAGVDLPYAHPGKSAGIYLGKFELARIYQLHPAKVSSFDFSCKQQAYIAELDLELIQKYIPKYSKYQALSKYQATQLDLSFVVDNSEESATIQTLIQKAHKNLIQEVSLIDTYRGEALPEEKKALVFRIMIQSDKETLTDQQIKEVQNTIIEKCAEKGYSLR